MLKALEGFTEEQIGQLDRESADEPCRHQDTVQRLAEVPGLGVNSAQPIIAEVGARSAVFSSQKNLLCGREFTRKMNRAREHPTDIDPRRINCHMRRVLNQAAHAAVKSQGASSKSCIAAGSTARTSTRKGHARDFLCRFIAPPHLGDFIPIPVR